ncbi:LysE family translocator [Dickeya zeae]|uniref:LysE family translocator n=1 Tax=Dickeya zeae TaxID=204042 RepID=UPI001CFA7B0D|nr:LysE family translocator [Dickeya zeae]UCZ75867.1 LysE family translocator [Dickeya zeae]
MTDDYLFGLSLVMIFSLPGPDMILLLQTASTAGKRAGLITALGLGTAKLCHVILAAFGLGTMFRVSPWTFDVVKYVGAAYLLWLGIKMLRPGSFFRAPEQHARKDTSNTIHHLVKGLLTNLLNPKALLFTSVLLPQFIHPENGSVISQFFLLGMILVLTGFVFDATYALAGGIYGRFLENNIRFQRIQQLFFSIILIGFAVRLVMMSHA